MIDRKTTALPLIALIGRTSVGKSTLWNRLTEQKNAITSDQSHITRDRHYGQVVWRGEMFELVDTGGLDVEKTEIGDGIKRQGNLALQEADLVLFLVDAQSGIVPEDRLIANQIREAKKDVILLVNKCDKRVTSTDASDPSWRQLGLGEPRPISAVTSLGLGDVLDTIHEKFAAGHGATIETKPLVETEALRIALVGRPNVGKSSLTNAILGEERVIVSAIAHTTREPQDTAFRYKDQDLVLIDTAGMRRMAKIDDRIEEEGIRRNRQAIDDADVALLVFDATQDPTSQDRHLAGVLEYARKGLILVANKWDLVENKTVSSAQDYEFLIRQLFPFLSWAPMVFTSVKDHQRIHALLDTAIEVEHERNRRIDYNALNRLLKSCIKSMKPLQTFGPKSPRIYDAAQVSVCPPTFVITVVGEKESVHQNWVRFFEKRLRLKFGFKGTPIVVKAQNIPTSKSEKKHNQHGPGMEAVAGKIREKPKMVNQTMRRQKWRT